MKLLKFSKKESFCLSKAHTRFISLCNLDNTLFCKFIYLTLFVSYAQIFFQTSQLAGRYFAEGPEQHLAIQTLENVFTFENQILLFTCCTVILYFIIFIISLLITIYETLNSTQIHSFGTQIWSLLIQIHAPLLFFPINNLCNQIQALYLDDSLQIFNSISSNTIIFYSSIIIWVINTIFAALPYVFLFNILPSRNSLSSKNFYVDQISLYQKLFISIFAKILPKNLSVNWFIILLNSSFSIARHFCCLYFLPRYHFKTLALELSWTNTCSLISILTVFVFGLSKAFSLDINKTEFVEILLFLAFLVIIYSKSLHEYLIKKIIIKPFEALNPYRALHKIFALKYLEKSMKKPSKRADYIDLNYFYFSITQRKNYSAFIGEENDSSEINLNITENQNEVKRKCIENLVTLHSKVDEFKLLLAKIYAKDSKLYVLAFKTLAKIKSSSFVIQNSAKLLRLQIQDHILTNQAEKKEGKINLNQYFIIEKHKESLKSQMNKQLQLQNDFWKEFTKSSPNILALQRISETIHKQKQLISRNCTLIENNYKESFRHICSLYACFQFLLNDSPAKAKEYIKKFKLLIGRHIQQKQLTLSNLYDLNNFSITIRANQDNVGSIVNCSNSIKRILGYNKNDIVGSSIGVLMSPFIAEKHNGFLQDYINTGQSKFISKIQRVYIEDRMGSLRKAYLWVNIHPFIYEEIQLTGIFRVVDNNKEYILLTPHGDIDSCTTKIAAKLNIQNKKVHINTICNNFLSICETYNSLNFKPANMDRENVGMDSAENSLQSARLLLPSKDLNQDQINSFRSDIKNCLRLRRSKINCQLGFSSYSNGLKSANRSKTYQQIYKCKAKTIYIREDPMIILQVEMVDQKEKICPKGVQQTIMDFKTDTKYRTSQFDEILENAHTGTTELISPERTNLVKRTTKIMSERIQEEEGNILYAKEESTPIHKLETKRISTNYNAIEAFLNENPRENRKNIEVVRYQDSASGSSTSLKERREAYVEEVYETKYYPKFVKILLLIVLTLFLANLVLQFSLLIKSRKDLKDLNTLTTTLNMANLRADAFTQIGRGARAAYFTQAGLAPKGSTFYKNLLDAFMGNLQTNIPILRSTNAELQVAIQDIEEIFQEKFKALNVKIYDINPDLTIGPYQRFNTFTAINVYVEKLLKDLNYYIQAGEFIVQRLCYILINSVNDMLEGTINAINLIFESIQFSFQNIATTFEVCQILIIFLVALGALTIFWFVFSVYHIEMTLIQQYLEIDPQCIQLVRNRLDYFEKIFQSENFDRFGDFDFSALAILERKMDVLENKKTTRSDQTINKKGLQQFHLKKALVLLLVLIFYIIGIHLIFQKIIQQVDKLRVTIKGINIAQSMLYETSILAFAVGQTLCNDTTNTVRNRPIEEELSIDLNNYLKRGHDLLEAFTEKDGTYNPLVVPYFSDNPCKFMPPLSLASSHCAFIVKDAKDFGLFPIIARQYSLNSQIYQNFKASDKSLLTLSKLVLDFVRDVSPGTGVIREIAMALIKTVQRDLDSLWQSTTTSLNAFLTLYPLMLLIIGVLTWKCMLADFVECANRFKRMMRITPLNILVLNPNLKGILMIFSNGKLQQVNYDI